MKSAVTLFFLGCSLFDVATASYKVHLSGSWYPEKKADLQSALTAHEEYAQKHYEAHLHSSKMRAIICPHAGYQYSGNVAAAAYRLVKQNYFKKVIVLAPSHHQSFTGVGLPDKKYFFYKNSLGSLYLDKKTLDALALDSSVFSYKSHAHELDHSINVQLPFIQRFCGKQCQLIPLLIGDITEQQAEKIADTLLSYIDEQTLVIVSSDFTHYGKRFDYEPFKQQVAHQRVAEQNIVSQIYQLDSKLVAQIQDQSLHGFDKVLQETGATVCGKNPIKVLLALMQQKAFGDIDTYVVAYDTSAAGVEKNPDHCVSYVSCVVSNELAQNLSCANHLTGYEKELLLKIARNHIDDVVQGVAESKICIVPGLLTKSLQKLSGAFVTLNKIGHDGYKQLRGCIGSVAATKPLYQAVYDMAVAAALHDSRFPPVVAQELRYIDVSISVLTALESVPSLNDIVIGRDGVVLQHGRHSAVYLPQVAIEQGWNLEEMLASLSQKAELPAMAWKDKDTHYQIFQSCDFGEDKDPLEVMYEGYKK